MEKEKMNEDIKHSLSIAGLLDFADTHRFDPPLKKAYDAIITEDWATLDAKNRAYKLASLKCDINVLILGETGTGKELFARLIHGDRHGKFVAVNCGGIPDTLVESEFFGVTKGAFTGADRDRKGYFEEASKGTLFLDEIAELDRSLQSKLLRVIQEKKVRRIGSMTEIPIDCRIVSATNYDVLELKSNKKFFRQDLFYRLAGSVITLKPLYERGNDYKLIAEKLTGLIGFPLPEGNRWYGNIRELINFINEYMLMNKE